MFDWLSFILYACYFLSMPCLACLLVIQLWLFTCYLFWECSLKSCLFKCTQKIVWQLLFLVLNMCFVIAPSLFDIVKKGGYVIIIEASFMNLWFSCFCECLWLVVSMLVVIFNVDFMHVHWYVCMFMSACSQLRLLTCLFKIFHFG